VIPGLGPIAPNGIAYLALASGLVLLAWSSRRDYFIHALALTGAVMAISWLGPGDLLAMLAFQVAPFVAIGRLWGKKQAAAGRMAVAVIALQIALFLVFKRYAWFDVLGTFDLPVTVVGISYILFRQIHLLIEAPYLGHLPFSLSRYLAFTLSPWTLIAGPIQRYDGFCAGLGEVGRPAADKALAALHRIASGLIKAFVLAPLLLPSADIGLLTRPTADWLDFAIVLYSYPAYLYLNFSGYVDVVIGIARVCGFTTLPENFDRPYLARNVRDFWTRWHISFGIWVRHFVFTPLSTALIRRAPANMAGLMMALTVMITFYLVGAWHGTTLNFVAFGLMQGAGVVVSASFERTLRRMLGKPGMKALDGNKLFYRADDYKNTGCAKNVGVQVGTNQPIPAYGFTYTPANSGAIYAWTNFYTPLNEQYYLQSACSSGTPLIASTNNVVADSTSRVTLASDYRPDSVAEILDMVRQGKMCISTDAERVRQARCQRVPGPWPRAPSGRRPLPMRRMTRVPGPAAHAGIPPGSCPAPDAEPEDHPEPGPRAAWPSGSDPAHPEVPPRSQSGWPSAPPTSHAASACGSCRSPPLCAAVCPR